MLLALPLLCLLTCDLFAQEEGAKVEYLERPRRNKVTRGGIVLTEDPVKMVVQQATTGVKTEIPAQDILDVIYDSEPAAMPLARQAEKNQNLDQAMASYKEAAGKTSLNQRHLRTHIAFKLVQLQTQQAEVTGNGLHRKEAIRALRDFKRENPGSRQIIPCLEMLSNLLVMDGQPAKEVVEDFRNLKAKYGNLSKELALRCDWFEIQTMLEEARSLLAEKPNEVKGLYEQIRKQLLEIRPNADVTIKLEVEVGLAECKTVLGQPEEALKDLNTILQNAGEDARTRAAAHLGRGDCHRLQKRYREAMWDYLWVDTVYNQDRDQHAHALYHLIEVFAKLSEPAKSKDCKDRLVSDPRFQGTRYQRLAAR
jgi:tetratricopeptide (TPR) repeat protein